jgi:hypothetical protein
MELPVPQVDRAALDRQKYELANYKKPGMLTRSTEWLKGNPDVSHAAKSGAPTMTDPKPTIPVSVPVVATVAADTNGTNAGSGTTDVTATRLTDSGGALDKQADARSSGGTAQAASTEQVQPAPLPTNRDKELKKLREQQAKKQAKLEKKKKKSDQQNGTISQQNSAQAQQNQSNATQGAQTPLGTPAASTPAAATATQPATGTKPPSSQNQQPEQ